MTFTSGAPRNADPKPYRTGEVRLAKRRAREIEAIDEVFYRTRHEPRPEYALPARDDVNPILVVMREKRLKPREVLDAFAPGFDQFAYPYTAAQIEHAVKVAQKLSVL